MAVFWVYYKTLIIFTGLYRMAIWVSWKDTCSLPLRGACAWNRCYCSISQTFSNYRAHQWCSIKSLVIQ